MKILSGRQPGQDVKVFPTFQEINVLPETPENLHILTGLSDRHNFHCREETFAISKN
jgi:hypothetical protein